MVEKCESSTCLCSASPSLCHTYTWTLPSDGLLLSKVQLISKDMHSFMLWRQGVQDGAQEPDSARQGPVSPQCRVDLKTVCCACWCRAQDTCYMRHPPWPLWVLWAPYVVWILDQQKWVLHAAQVTCSHRHWLQHAWVMHPVKPRLSLTPLREGDWKRYKGVSRAREG